MSADEVDGVLRAARTREAKADPVKRGAVPRRDDGLHALPLAGRRGASGSCPGMKTGRRHPHPHRAVRRLPDRQPDVGQGDRPRQLDRRRDQARDHAGHAARRHAPAAVPDGLAVVLDADARRPRTRSSRTCGPCRRSTTRCRGRRGRCCPSICGASSRCWCCSRIRRSCFFPGNAGTTKGGRSMKKILKWTLVALLVARRRRRSSRSCISSRRSSSRRRRRSRRTCADARRRVADIADPAERAIAERGRYIVMTTGCIGCHGTPGPQGPRLRQVPGRRPEVQHPAGRDRQPQPDAGSGRPAWRAAPTTRSSACCGAACSRTATSCRTP